VGLLTRYRSTPCDSSKSTSEAWRTEEVLAFAVRSDVPCSGPSHALIHALHKLGEFLSLLVPSNIGASCLVFVSNAYVRNSSLDKEMAEAKAAAQRPASEPQDGQ
ncbi:unnamed protein product, partial [Ectocarpus sp. 12 AP-2014]